MLIQATCKYFGIQSGGFNLEIGEVYKLEFIEYVNEDDEFILVNIEDDKSIEIPRDDVFQCTVRDLKTKRVQKFWAFYFDIKSLKRNIIINSILAK